MQHIGEGWRFQWFLSPIIYALKAEHLLDLIDDLVPGCLTRAYADDTASVIQDFWKVAPSLIKLFEDWRKVSGPI